MEMMNKTGNPIKGLALFRRFAKEIPRDKKVRVVINWTFKKPDVIEDEFISLLDAYHLTLSGKKTLRSVTIPFADIRDVKQKSKSAFQIKTNDKNVESIIIKILE